MLFVRVCCLLLLFCLFLFVLCLFLVCFSCLVCAWVLHHHCFVFVRLMLVPGLFFLSGLCVCVACYCFVVVVVRFMFVPGALSCFVCAWVLLVVVFVCFLVFFVVFCLFSCLSQRALECGAEQCFGQSGVNRHLQGERGTALLQTTLNGHQPMRRLSGKFVLCFVGCVLCLLACLCVLG